MNGDKNFDDLSNRFQSRIYGGFKGQWRLQSLKEDLSGLAVSGTRHVLDAGCGAGHMALWLAGQGHQVTLSDISKHQLSEARGRFRQVGCQADFFQLPLQAWFSRMANFDLLLIHAVLEWLADPEAVLSRLLPEIKSGAWLSLLFYNRNAMVFCNALRGGWRLEPLLTDRYLGVGRRLSPPNPLYPSRIEQLLLNNNFHIQTYTGIRVFHDYLPKSALADSDMASLQQLELRYCRAPDFRALGRYIHFLARKR